MLAIGLWKKALGGPPSKETGHSLVFREVTHNSEEQFCSTFFNETTYNGISNPNVEQGVLNIYMTPNDGKDGSGISSADVGYNYTEGAHRIMFISAYADEVTVAHEVSVSQCSRIQCTDIA